MFIINWCKVPQKAISQVPSQAIRLSVAVPALAEEADMVMEIYSLGCPRLFGLAEQACQAALPRSR